MNFMTSAFSGRNILSKASWREEGSCAEMWWCSSWSHTEFYNIKMCFENLKAVQMNFGVTIIICW